MTDLQKLIELKSKLQEHVETMMDDIERGGYVDEKHNVNISFGDHTYSLGLHADLYDGLNEFIDEQIKHEKEEM